MPKVRITRKSVWIRGHLPVCSHKSKAAHKLFPTYERLLQFVWCHQESNRGHKDFQSFALPTELWHPAYLRVQRYDNILDCASNPEFFFSFSCFFPDVSILVP